ncbi:YbcN family protein [Enterobacter hormaechei]|uniref:YbcN family protein n=1 Tax=Enterobacter cloacae complex TaxID=354276 RepID=UPI0005F09CDE|nr:YbcN family protein [Enterobacter hormaechei]WBN63422.1 YbcN family protein [Enterobacter cloacae]EKW2262999.1 YbcN family protein [Enterobacter hormaechei]EKW9492186.1 YbcN family protein [Enterobacter hormaechei]ELC6488109.1 YbcN family protein [Enterobacter hormaechei]ELD4128854.1 YbcN family protein [Enterobacter hormaechei]
MNIPQCGIKLHAGNFAAVGKLLQEQLATGQPLRLQVKPWREKRSLSQNALSHMWYTEISNYLIARGKTFATPEWVKDAMKHTYLGYESKDRVDVVSGEVTTVQSLRHTSELETGEMYIFLCKVEAWAMNIGCHLTIPQSCEYQQLRDKQEA